MSKFEKPILKILQGFSDKNIDFEDLQKKLLKLEFDKRIKGSHYIHTKENVVQLEK